MGSLVDYLPDSERGQSVLILKDGSTIADLLSYLKINEGSVLQLMEMRKRDWGMFYLMETRYLYLL